MATPLQLPQEVPIPGDLPKELQVSLRTLVEEFKHADGNAHERVSSECRVLEKYWKNIQDLIWDDASRDWVSASGVLQSSTSTPGDVDPTLLDKVVGIYRAYGEVFAAALSTALPSVRFFPDDADNPADISTAKAFSIISELVQKHNDAPLLFLRILYILYNQHFAAIYNTHSFDRSFGSIERNIIDIKPVTITTSTCPECGSELTPTDMQPVCELCGSEGPGIDIQSTEMQPYVRDVIELPKGREILEAYGPRNVRVPAYIKSLEQSPYLILETEHNVAFLSEVFPQLEDKLIRGGQEEGNKLKTDRKGRFEKGTESDVLTLTRVWFRSWAFNLIKDKEKKQQLKTQFPDGCYVAFVETEFAEAYPEKIDDHWTFIEDPFADKIHGEPRGKMVVPLQDMVNDLENLSIETILYNVPETYADPRVYNFKEAGQKENKPGSMTPARALDGQTLSAGFWQPSGATLSKEAGVFRDSLDKDSQFLLGIPPSVWGGPLGGGDRTLGEYQQSRAQALQRLSVIWKAINITWAKVMLKASKSYKDNLMEDEKLVKKEGDGFVNVWIRESELLGEVGQCEPESSENFPISWEQVRGIILELLNTNAPIVQSILQDPTNVGELSRTMGLSKFKTPGEDDRDKQLWEIAAILKGIPVQPEPEVDNNEMHVATIRSWANSAAGRETKMQNPQAYEMILMHLRIHLMVLQQQMMAELEQQAMMQSQPKQTGQKQPRNEEVQARPKGPGEAVGRKPE